VSSFDARLRLPGQAKLPLGVVVDISHERITLTSGDRKVAGWLIEDVDIASRSDGFHIRVDNEELVLNVTDPAKFAIELGIAEKRSKQLAVVGAKGRPAAEVASLEGRKSSSTNGKVEPAHAVNGTSLNEQYEADIRGRIADVTEALTSDSVAPAEVFARWLGLLKEINRRHGQGSMSTDLHYRLNTQLLDLIPEPAPAAGTDS